MQELTDYINSYFSVSKSDINEIANHFRLTELKKGKYFLKIGRKCDKISFIKSGIIRIYREVDNKEITQWISTRGNFVTDLASFNFQSDGRWNIIALTDCELYTINRNTYSDLVNIIPKWAEIDKQFVTRCFVSLEERIFNQLYMTAEERFNKLFAENSELFNQVPLQYLASMLGITPETLSRLRTKSIREFS
jgi:CRP/FNR family transcriptional regulator, anaerobic regulatory protein